MHGRECVLRGACDPYGQPASHGIVDDEDAAGRELRVEGVECLPCGLVEIAIQADQGQSGDGGGAEGVVRRATSPIDNNC